MRLPSLTARAAGLFATLAISSAASASLVMDDNFDSYSVGNLATQGGWTESSSGSPNIQVVGAGSDKNAQLANTGQDVFKALSSTVAHTDGNGIFTAVDLTVNSVKATGDYFLHLANGSTFAQLLSAKTSGAGYVLGLTDSTSGTATYGSTVLTLATEYRIVIAWNFQAGADPISLYVAPTSNTQASNTAYVSISAATEPSQFTRVNFRQGNSSNAAAVALDNLAVATTFAELVPEPSGLALFGIASAALLRRRSRQLSK